MMNIIHNRLPALPHEGMNNNYITWSSISSSNTSCSTTSWHQAYGNNTIKDDDEKNIDAEVMRHGLPKKERLTIFIYDSINYKTITLVVSENLKIKSILNCMIKTESAPHSRYFLIHKETQRVLNTAKSLSDYQIKTRSILILARRKVSSSKVFNHTQFAVKKRLIIICNFGAPYNKKFLSSYHGDLSLNEYAIEIKDKFCMPQATKITFNFRGIPCLGIDRICPIKKLGIAENDTIIAQTNGINFTLKSFGSTNKTKLIEMYKYFNLNQLKQQIVLELGISISSQKALICKGWRIIDNDAKCKDIKEYETITVLTACECHLSKAKSKCIQSKCNYPSHTQLSAKKSAAKTHYNGDNYLYYLHRSHYTSTCPRSNHKIYRKKVEIQPQREYYQHDNNQDEELDDDESSTSSDYEQEDDNDELRTNNNSNSYYVNTLKLCRWGDQCRYYNSPQIFGPCRYYHPPPISQQINCSWKSYYTLHHGTTKKNKYKTNYTMIY